MDGMTAALVYLDTLNSSERSEITKLNFSYYELSWDDVSSLCSFLSSNPNTVPNLQILDLSESKIFKNPKEHIGELKNLVGLFDSRKKLIYIDISNIVFRPVDESTEFKFISTDNLSPTEVRSFYGDYITLQEKVASKDSSKTLVFMPSQIAYDLCEKKVFTADSKLSSLMRDQRRYYSNFCPSEY
jgi:hypothetical protein